ncbi:serine peptidase [Streptomyces sp. NBC_01762]|uniref:serine peptidase n=1 Tax=unclassified Streptomyces TaxID=2593676 RepID=UPI002DDBB991|nr:MULTISPECIES: serine peptidase [unclassified Streptomyces]WSC49557.1 serine peptidase [Streptomyces sp. NBC_01762]WSD29130.1 serine peptidase [Streptomyces sp. NBC_01751]
MHGVGNSFGAGITGTRLEHLRALKAAAWARQLGNGVGVSADRIDLDFAYYADKLLTTPPAQGEHDGDFLDNPLAQEMLAAWAQELGVPDEVSQGHATVPLRALSSWVARRFDLADGALRVFLRMLFPEVATYLRTEDAPERTAAREEVAARIDRHRPQVVIAHSLGSVVAYEALHAYPGLQPDLFLTLGSPLALPRAVFERLTPAPRPARGVPQGVRLPGQTRWVNIADPGDPVAVPPQLGRHFEGIALDHTSVISPLFHFHHATNYLQSATTAATIAPYLGI